VSSEEFGFSPS